MRCGPHILEVGAMVRCPWSVVRCVLFFSLLATRSSSAELLFSIHQQGNSAYTQGNFNFFIGGGGLYPTEVYQEWGIANVGQTVNFDALTVARAEAGLMCGDCTVALMTLNVRTAGFPDRIWTDYFGPTAGSYAWITNYITKEGVGITGYRLTGITQTLDIYAPVLGGYTAEQTIRFYGAHAPLTVGDFNRDRVVDASDYVFWRDALGTSTSLWNTIGAPHPANQADYLGWAGDYGAHEVPIQGGVTTVPEPDNRNGAMLLFTISALWFVFRPRKRRRTH